ncbi:MAG: twin-arginine translocase TatA/TatE family subunit [Phycisphaerae bacterium]|jgi:sec-independent protein translocase protein TatA|nr:twin-arginine translocase TatA/TatE family subunit [Phycisphaerae bacterium]HOO16902.1 twin-arginine translocase TatA/TatE family subunit [Phycisphaerae bacterium]HPC22595.1 twin-arginine translocase TatA/TatE family subunit [Phycisphaerae bacterium]HRS28558.1 twin-arginine translocase TatA/TatE family subunit [Phycisphaerae bacterium]HRT41357.1 twin-arginine translocase TatA/TatE family subunit [Phycisphaerae bacterium]
MILAWLDHWTILLVGLVALLLFGSRLPEVARSLGRSLNEFKRGLNEINDEIDRAPKDPNQPKLRSPSEPRLDSPAPEPRAEATPAQNKAQYPEAPPEGPAQS